MRDARHLVIGSANDIRHPDGIEDLDEYPEFGAVRPVPLPLSLVSCQLGILSCLRALLLDAFLRMTKNPFRQTFGFEKKEQ